MKVWKGTGRRKVIPSKLSDFVALNPDLRNYFKISLTNRRESDQSKIKFNSTLTPFMCIYVKFSELRFEMSEWGVITC
jgi:hypothetical protein